MLYCRRGFTAFRSYSSDEEEWSLEAKVTGAGLVGTNKMNHMRHGVVVRGGRAVYWMTKDAVFGLRLDTLEAATARADLSWPELNMGNHALLGTTPRGRLCAVRLDVDRRRSNGIEAAQWHYTLRILSFDDNNGGDGGGRDSNDDGDDDDDMKLEMDRVVSETKNKIWVGQFSLDNVVYFKLRWFCEESGVVFFSALELSDLHYSRYYTYAFSMDAKTVEKKVASQVVMKAGDPDPWGNVHGYEMDQATYLASLAQTHAEDTRNVLVSHNDVDHPLSALSI
ncbi:hypothetical protein QOZ80_8BG0645710 [Eleusine coracana subsp. coracana]|nr:hypothetical protein QOZ80_8BG0645710 [Eleusine coracana subsp. coracana]